jgi:hypothetical protein
MKPCSTSLIHSFKYHQIFNCIPYLSIEQFNLCVTLGQVSYGDDRRACLFGNILTHVLVFIVVRFMFRRTTMLFSHVTYQHKHTRFDLFSSCRTQSRTSFVRMEFIRIVCVFAVFMSIVVNRLQANLGSELFQSVKRLVRSNCFCHDSECCSKWGYCGKTDDYCGEGCRSGPCKSQRQLRSDVTSFQITSTIFACVFSNLDETERARRYDGLMDAMKQMAWQPVNDIEAAIFLAHVSHETDGLRTLVEYCSKHACQYRTDFDANFIRVSLSLSRVFV